jgi:hypothetical protein
MKWKNNNGRTKLGGEGFTKSHAESFYSLIYDIIIVSSVNVFQKAFNRKSLKWEWFHSEIMLGCFRIVIKIRLKIKFDRFSIVKMSNFTFNRISMTIRKHPFWIFIYQKRLVIFLKESFLFISNWMREIKRNN